MRLRIAAMTFALLCSWCVAPAATQAQPIMTDQTITDQVEDELLSDTAVISTSIDVETNDGIVTLDGNVNNILAKERATRLAQTVRGVRSVVNQIEVQPLVSRTDRQIEDDIESALLMDAATESYEIDVDVKNGVAAATGTVESWQEKELAAKVIKGVRGVTGLKNNLTVDYAITRPDPEIEREIEEALKWNVYVDNSDKCEVEVEDGHVTLSGTVGSAAERATAVQTAWVNGVRDVNSDELAVANWADDETSRNDPNPSVTPAQIKDAVEDALLYDPRVKSFNITVEAIPGGVTLRGNVSNLKAKRAAAQVARNTYGVNSVNNRLKVRTESKVSDADLASRVRNALIRDPFTEQYEITVAVTNGVADLYGTVDTYFEKSQAEDVASRIDGIVLVDNHISVDTDYSPYIYDPYVDDSDPQDYDWYTDEYAPLTTLNSDAEIEEDIKDELWWSPFVDADQVTVNVEDGRATLTGVVDSAYEKQTAAENAMEGGATSVTNNLVVEY